MVDLRKTITRVALVSMFVLGASMAGAQAPNDEKPDRAGVTIDPATVMQPWTGDLDEMVARRMIRVLVVPSQTFYFNDRGRQRGITYEAFQLVEKELGKQLARGKKLKGKRPGVKFFFVSVRRDEIFKALMAGEGDIAAADLTVTPQRQEIVDFTAPTRMDVRDVVVTGPASPTVASLDDLGGKEVFVRKSSSYYEHLIALNARLATEKKPLVQIKEAPEELEDEDLLEMLNAGLVPVLVVDQHVADFWKKVFPKIEVHHSVALETGGQTAWAIRKGSPKLKAFLDGVTKAMATGHLQVERQVILARYLKHLTHVKNAASETQRKKFLGMVDLFRKYGDRYDVDWLLMAAQGYQESRLNQTARSPVGAIGVMQIMPATGKAMKVGDITKLDPNIHAGVKYIRFMIDRYYEKEPMAELDKVLFSFAAYNAGPGRVGQLRREAARRGLDPNVWFHNVEYVAEEKIGHETVTYVSNIFKYYIAYRLIEDALAKRQDAKGTLKDSPK